MKNLIALCILGASLTTAANAQTLVSRTSGQSYSYVYGAALDTHSDNFSDSVTTLIDSDGMFNDFTGETSGVAPGNQPYSANVALSASHAYTVSGPLNNFSSILMEGGVGTESMTSGIGTASASVADALTLEFTLAGDTEYNFQGVLEFTDFSPTAFSYIALQQWNGIVWANIYTTIFEPGLQGSFNQSGTLGAGLYRLDHSVSVVSSGNDFSSAGYYYNFEAVPEPVTMFAIAPALMLIARKRKRA